MLNWREAKVLIEAYIALPEAQAAARAAAITEWDEDYQLLDLRMEQKPHFFGEDSR